MNAETEKKPSKARRFVTKALIENDRTTQIIGEQIRLGMIQNEGEIDVISVEEIRPSNSNPRKIPWNESNFDDYKQGNVPDEHKDAWNDLESLSQSISNNGLLQPIIVRKAIDGDGSYEIIAGERRYWAIRLLGKKVVRAIVRKVTEKQHKTMALTENVARADLTLSERVIALKELIELDKQYLNNTSASNLLGISRYSIHYMLEAIHNSDIFDKVVNGEITVLRDIRNLIDGVETEKKEVEKPVNKAKPKLQRISHPTTFVKLKIQKDDQELILEAVKKFNIELYERLMKNNKGLEDNA